MRRTCACTRLCEANASKARYIPRTYMYVLTAADEDVFTESLDREYWFSVYCYTNNENGFGTFSLRCFFIALWLDACCGPCFFLPLHVHVLRNAVTTHAYLDRLCALFMY